MQKIKIILLLALTIYSVNAQTSQEDEATQLSSQVVKLFNEGKFKEAIPIAEKVVMLREKEFGEKHIKTGEALRNLGLVQLRADNRKDAEKTLEKAVEIYEDNLLDTNDFRNQFGQMLETIGYLKLENGKIDKSIEYYKKAVEQREKVYGKDSLETARPLWALGNLYQSKKDYKNSEIYYRRVLEIRAKKLGAGNYETQDAKNRYQCVSVRNDNREDAETFIKSLDAENKNEIGVLPNSEVKLVKGGVINGKATNLAKPAYPLEARASRASGAVSVQVIINESGKVIFACALSGNKLLYDASEAAAYQSTFQPTTLSGQPVKVFGVIVYNFQP